MQVIERRRDLLDQMLLLEEGEQIKLTFDKPLDVQNYRYKLYQTLTAIGENPEYANGIYQDMPNMFKLSWKRKKEPTYLYITRRTNEEYRNIEIKEAQTTLPPYLQNPDEVYTIMESIIAGGAVMILSAHQITAEQLNLVWELHMTKHNQYEKRAFTLNSVEDKYDIWRGEVVS